jgi:hypothetical protein
VSLATKDEGQGASVTVSIHDIAGRTVRNLTLKASGSAFSASADLSDLPKGVYFITREPQAPDFKSQSLGKVILAR